jgi:CheY-like chemotaxis protein
MANRKRILLAEDDTASRCLFSAALAGAGFQVIEAANGSDAVEIALERASAYPPEPIHGLVTDFQMPGIVLASLCKELYKDLAIVIISGVSNTDAKLAGNLDRAEFLNKPLTLGSLVNALCRALGEQPFESRYEAA